MSLKARRLNIIIACCFPSSWWLVNDCIQVFRPDVTSTDSTDETASLLRRSDSVKRSNSRDRGGVNAANSDWVVASEASKADGTVKDILHDSLMNFERSEGITKGASKQNTISQWAFVSSSTERVVGGKIQWIALVVRMGLCFSGSSARAVVKSSTGELRDKR